MALTMTRMARKGPLGKPGTEVLTKAPANQAPKGLKIIEPGPSSK